MRQFLLAIALLATTPAGATARFTETLCGVLLLNGPAERINNRGEIKYYLNTLAGHLPDGPARARAERLAREIERPGVTSFAFALKGRAAIAEHLHLTQITLDEIDGWIEGVYLMDRPKPKALIKATLPGLSTLVLGGAGAQSIAAHGGGWFAWPVGLAALAFAAPSLVNVGAAMVKHYLPGRRGDRGRRHLDRQLRHMEAAVLSGRSAVQYAALNGVIEEGVARRLMDAKDLTQLPIVQMNASIEGGRRGRLMLLDIDQALVVDPDGGEPVFVSVVRLSPVKPPVPRVDRGGWRVRWPLRLPDLIPAPVPAGAR